MSTRMGRLRLPELGAELEDAVGQVDAAGACTAVVEPLLAVCLALERGQREVELGSWHTLMGVVDDTVLVEGVKPCLG